MELECDEIKKRITFLKDENLKYPLIRNIYNIFKRAFMIQDYDIMRYLGSLNIDYQYMWGTHGRNLLMIAVRSQNIEMVNFLINLDIFNINTIDDYEYAAISYAINLKNIELVKILMANGADLNYYKLYKISPHKSPFVDAIRSNNLEIIEHLIFFDVDADVYKIINDMPEYGNAIRQLISQT